MVLTGLLAADASAAGRVAIRDARAQEGRAVTLTVRLSAPQRRSLSVRWATRNATATAGADYRATAGTLRFRPRQRRKTITVRVMQDALAEPRERFAVVLRAAHRGTRARFSRARAFVTIAADAADLPTPLPSVPPATLPSSSAPPVTQTPAPSPKSTLSVADATAAEGSSGATTPVAFTVTRGGDTSIAATADYATSDGTATTGGTAAAGGDDYDAAIGTVSFPPGETTETVTVLARADAVDEDTETLMLTLTDPSTDVTIVDGSGTATITDDDAAPSLSFADLTASEGTGGPPTTFTGTVTLSAPTSRTVTVQYATSDGTATAGSDYTSATGTLTFAPGDTTEDVTVSVSADALDETDEAFTLSLSAPANATIGDGAATATITDDDATPSLAIADSSVTEGNSGTTTLSAAVTLGAASGRSVTVDYATSNGTATAGSDYVAETGTLTFAPGDVSETVTVTVNGDVAVEPGETFAITLSNPSNATVADGSATATITNDEVDADGDGFAPPPSGSDCNDGSASVYPGAPEVANSMDDDCDGAVDEGTSTLSIGDSSLAEGNSGSRLFTFLVTRSGNLSGDATATWTTSNGTATAPGDYLGGTGTVTIPSGEFQRSISISVFGDVNVEPDETFSITLTNPVNAQLGDAFGLGTILNDD